MEETPLKGHSSSSAFNISAASGLRRRPRRSSSGPPHISAPFDFENCLPPQQNFGISDHENFTGLSASSQVEQPRAPFDYENFPQSETSAYENWYTRMERVRLRMAQHRDKELTLNVDGQWRKHAQTITKHNPSPRDYCRCSITPDYTVKKKVPQDLCMASLDHIYPIIGIDFTKSNEWTGKYSFNCRSLHDIGDTQNPYEQAISIIGRTLSSFNEDKIHCFGFGDASTQDKHVFSFNPNKRPCNDVKEVLTRYREMATQLRLAGPTSFAPIIEMATAIVKQSDRQGHVLLIIADGQVTRSIDIEPGHLSPQEEKTIKAIEKASQHPLSIILVGVGDGPWDRVREFKDNIPTRAFDNFHFVNFTEIMSKNMPLSQKETEFAHAVLAEILSQYEAIVELNILGRRSGGVPMSDPSNLNVTVEQLAVNVIEDLVLLPPALKNNNAASFSSRPSHLHSFQASSSRHHEDTLSIQISPYHGHTPVAGTSPASASWDNQVCPICLTKPKDMAFGCGHQTCCKCGESLQSCPLCRRQIKIRIKLY